MGRAELEALIGNPRLTNSAGTTEYDYSVDDLSMRRHDAATRRSSHVRMRAAYTISVEYAQGVATRIEVLYHLYPYESAHQGH